MKGYFSLLDSLPGFSLWPELYDADYREAGAFLEQKIRSADALADVGEKAETRFCEGAVKLFQGEVHEARRIFRQLGASAESPVPVAVRAYRYHRLAEAWQYDLFPDRNGARAREVRIRRAMEENIPAVPAEWNNLHRQKGHAVASGADCLLVDFLVAVQAHRTSVRSALMADAAYKEQILETALQAIAYGEEEFRTTTSGPVPLAALQLLRADVFLRAGKEVEFRVFLDRAYESFADCEHLAGLAACALLEGDQYAAPFSSPLILNLELKESTTATNDLGPALEEREGGLRGFDPEKALENYLDARDYYTEQGSEQGLGQVFVRLAYLQAQSGNFEGAIMQIGKAIELFTRVGDGLSLNLGLVHRMLYRVGRDPLFPDRESAVLVAEWGRTSGSFSFALGLGLLCCRQYRYWLNHKADYQRARACVELAGDLFGGIGAPTNFVQTLGDKAFLDGLRGDSDGALASYEEAARQLSQMIKDGAPQQEFAKQLLSDLTRQQRQFLKRSGNISTFTDQKS